jgi:hypothetical protein
MTQTENDGTTKDTNLHENVRRFSWTDVAGCDSHGRIAFPQAYIFRAFRVLRGSFSPRGERTLRSAIVASST